MPPPPWTRTIPGAFLPGSSLGIPTQAKTRVGFPFQGRPSKKTALTPSAWKSGAGLCSGSGKRAFGSVMGRGSSAASTRAANSGNRQHEQNGESIHGLAPTKEDAVRLPCSMPRSIIMGCDGRVNPAVTTPISAGFDTERQRS